MGGGFYSSVSRTVRAENLGYYTKSSTEIFKQKTVNSAMNPYGVTMRESRDSAEHPESLAIIIALDVTGSMGSIPHYLVKDGLPTFVDGLIKVGIKDPQVLFLAVGDHTCDSFPLQVGQFESSDELLDKWLTTVYLEGGGGANDGESYHLAWYFAGYYTAIDCYEKRKQKGFLFTIGDEPVLRELPRGHLKQIMGAGQYEDMTSLGLLDKARQMYDVYHLHLKEGISGRRESVMNGWRQMLGENLIIVNSKNDIANIMVTSVIGYSPKVGNTTEAVITQPTAPETEMIL